MQISRIVFAYLINLSKNCFQHAITKKQVLTAVPSKKRYNSVKMSNVSKILPESREHVKPLLP